MKYSQHAVESGLVDNESLSAYGARGVLDPSMIDSDLDGIEDAQEDPDQDGLNRTGLIKAIVLVTMIHLSRLSQILTLQMAQFYQNLQITQIMKRCRIILIQCLTILMVISGMSSLSISRS